MKIAYPKLQHRSAFRCTVGYHVLTGREEEGLVEIPLRWQLYDSLRDPMALVVEAGALLVLLALHLNWRPIDAAAG